MEFGVVGVEVACGFKMTHAEHAVFDGTDPIDAPSIVGYGLGELALDGSLRVEAVDDLFGECFVGIHVFAGQHDDTRGEAVTQCVHAGAGAALRRGGSVRFFGIKAIGCVLCW